MRQPSRRRRPAAEAVSASAERFRQRRFRGWLLAAGLGAATAAAAAEPRVGLAVEGFDRARLLAPAGARVEDYENAGYRLRVSGGEVRIEVDVAALASTSRFAAPRPPGRDPRAQGPIHRLARSLTAGADTRYEAISRVLGWVAGAITYDLDRGAAQDAAAVLRRRSGYCTGVARLTVALLRAAGIPAREVPGYVVDPQATAERRSGYHRWIEAYLPDRGWVFSDPLRSHHYVPATYLRLAAEELTPARGIEGRLLERRQALAAVDPYHHGVPGITARRNSERQLAAALRIRLEGTGSGTAVLVGRSQRRRQPLVDGAADFVGLSPGSYRLRLTLADSVIERPVELTGRVRKSLWIPGTLSAPVRGSPKR